MRIGNAFALGLVPCILYLLLSEPFVLLAQLSNLLRWIDRLGSVGLTQRCTTVLGSRADAAATNTSKNVRLKRYYLLVSFCVHVDCDREEGVCQWYLRGLPLFTQLPRRGLLGNPYSAR
jgi:hypothetical protein